MRVSLRLAALTIFLATAAWWFLAGRNPGWTKDQVEVWKLDELTDIKYVDYEKRFVPGVDLLALSGGVSLLLGGFSFLCKKQ